MILFSQQLLKEMITEHRFVYCLRMRERVDGLFCFYVCGKYEREDCSMDYEEWLRKGVKNI